MKIPKAPPPAITEQDANQCDGCNLKLPLVNGFHIHPDKEGWERIHMGCTAAKYKDRQQDAKEGA